MIGAIASRQRKLSALAKEGAQNGIAPSPMFKRGFRCYEDRPDPNSHYYVLVNVEDRVAKVFHLCEGRYVKLADVVDETVEFDLGKCRIAFDFGRIWLR